MSHESQTSRPTDARDHAPSEALSAQVRRSVGGVLGLVGAFGPDDGFLPWWLPLVPGNRLRFNLGMKNCVDRAATLAKAGKYGIEEWSRSSRMSAHVVEACGGTIEVIGLENLAATEGPAVVAGNHMSALETFLLPSLIMSVKGKAAFVIKDELLKEGRFAPVMNAVPNIAITRTDAVGDLRKLRTEWPELHKKGHTVCIFPGGTRTPHFNAGKKGDDGYSPIAARMAANLKAPLVPCAVQTSMWSNEKRNGLYLVEPGPVRVAFGKALPVGTPDKDVHKASVDFLSATLRSWGVEVRDEDTSA